MPAPFDLVCLSHLRWDFVVQRPQHLLTRCARERRVFFIEEPRWGVPAARLDVSRRAEGVCIVVPQLPDGLSQDESDGLQRGLLDDLFAHYAIARHVLWYYTPMALGFTRHLHPLATVYDCMDELSSFRHAPPELRAREAELFGCADLVFTGGQSLYEAKRNLHPRVHPFPSSVDVAHFACARHDMADPDDQLGIRRPRIGFFGVIDERMDLGLVAGIADARPEWQLVMIGPVAKIDPAHLPRRENIHYLGNKRYAELPAYIGGWNVAMLPFARNDATRFISPTKTPEYLAAGCPVISTSIRDVMRPYGELGLARIADTPDVFVAAIEAAIAEDPVARRERADAFLRQMSWDRTWERMADLIEGAMRGKIDGAAGHASRLLPRTAVSSGVTSVALADGVGTD